MIIEYYNESNYVNVSFLPHLHGRVRFVKYFGIRSIRNWRSNDRICYSTTNSKTIFKRTNSILFTTNFTPNFHPFPEVFKSINYFSRRIPKNFTLWLNFSRDSVIGETTELTPLKITRFLTTSRKTATFCPIK